MKNMNPIEKYFRNLCQLYLKLTFVSCNASSDIRQHSWYIRNTKSMPLAILPLPKSHNGSFVIIHHIFDLFCRISAFFVYHYPLKSFINQNFSE